MSGMARFPSVRQSVSARWVLLILISCLALHFLIEDSLLLHASTTINPEFNNQQSYDEVTHQDDLATPICLPERITNCNMPVTLSLTVPFRKQSISPILPPPKIA